MALFTYAMSLPLSTHPGSGSGAVHISSVARTAEESDNAGRKFM